MELFKKQPIKTYLRFLLVGFYFVAGVNHFINPQFYLPLIPDYLPYPEFINWISGVLEVVLAISVIVPKYRSKAVWGIILLLIAFIPSHLWFIQTGACMGEESLCTPLWVAWIRLVPIHPLLMYWAWYVR
ncbi:MAG: hypothetical protein CMB99_03475 [Flavobacteriaceae bacterium]|nr:hypothetical protein [Flavobacteriaceae bacterium]|tara:strand:- start:160092 stop:160481 length:390 start_codon:yes stop_codon:yes gene_type:complete